MSCASLPRPRKDSSARRRQKVPLNRDRRYDFKNIFAEKFGGKMALLTKNKAKLFKILIITLVIEKIFQMGIHSKALPYISTLIVVLGIKYNHLATLGQFLQHSFPHRGELGPQR
jgi:hypothetical protein